MKPLSKKQLADALAQAPLGAQRNRIKLALVLTNLQSQRVALDIGIGNSRFSGIANGVIDPSPDEQKAIAKHFSTTVAVMFPNESRQEVA